jgi:hypothetical protein
MLGIFWACKCWSARGMSEHGSARPPKGMFYPSSAGALICVKSLVTCVQSILHATMSEQFVIADYCLLFGEDDYATFALRQVT